MKFNSENYQDIIKYFKNSYVKFPVTGEFLCTIDNVDSERITGKVYVPSEDGTSWNAEVYQQPITGDGIDLEYVMPRKSFFNHEGYANLLLRVPARQYKKGVCSENTTIYKLLNTGKFAGESLGFALLNAYVAKQAFLPFGTKQTSYAVSPRMACTKDGKVYTDKVQIGNLNPKDKVVHVFNQLFVSEVEKIISNHAQDWTVQVKAQPLPVVESIDELFDKFVKEMEEGQ